MHITTNLLAAGLVTLRPRLRRIDRILRLLLVAALFGFLMRWIPGRYVPDSWWNLPGTQPYHGTGGGPGAGEG